MSTPPKTIVRCISRHDSWKTRIKDPLNQHCFQFIKVFICLCRPFKQNLSCISYKRMQWFLKQECLYNVSGRIETAEPVSTTNSVSIDRPVSVEMCTRHLILSVELSQFVLHICTSGKTSWTSVDDWQMQLLIAFSFRSWSGAFVKCLLDPHLLQVRCGTNQRLSLIGYAARALAIRN